MIELIGIALLGLSQGVVTGATFAGIILGLSLVAGLLAGQFRRGVVGELRESLTTANTELDIERKRGDRLEAKLQSVSDRLTRVEAERKVLSETLQTGIRLAPEFTTTMARLLNEHEERSLRVLEHNAELVAARVAEANAQRIADWNTRLDRLEAKLTGGTQ